MQDVLTLATQDSDNPDLRDRGYIYWRLLSTDPEAAKQVVLAEKPNISDDTFALDPSVLDELISHLSTLAAIYHKPPATFVSGRTRAVPTLNPRSAEETEMVDSDATMTSDMMSAGAEGVQAAPPPVPAPSAGGLVDLLGLDLLSDDVSASPAPSTSSADKVILSAESGDGMQIRGTYVLQDGKMFQRMTLENKAITHRPASKDPLAGPLNSRSPLAGHGAALRVCDPVQQELVWRRAPFASRARASDAGAAGSGTEPHRPHPARGLRSAE